MWVYSFFKLHKISLNKITVKLVSQAVSIYYGVCHIIDIRLIDIKMPTGFKDI